jgi:hypothetical protein
MMSTELTESLRRNVLNERKQKRSNAVLKRRHTLPDLAKLKQFPEKLHITASAAIIPKDVESQSVFLGADLMYLRVSCPALAKFRREVCRKPPLP